MKITKPILLVSLLFPGVCIAEASDFNFVEVAYSKSKIKVAGDDVDLDGFGVKGSYKVNDAVFVSATYDEIALDESIPGVSFDGDAYSVGVGYIFDSNDTATVFGEFAYIDGSATATVTTTVGGIKLTDDEDGYSVGFGVRTNTSYRSELNFGVYYVDFDVDSDVGGYVEFVFEFFENVSGVASVSRVGEITSTGFGVRYSY